MIVPSLEYPRPPPVALGGTTSAAQITAARGNLAAQVAAGSAVYALLRWNIGLSAWEQISVNGAAVVVEPTEKSALGTASTIFAAIPGSYYTALLTTSQPNGLAANLLTLDIDDAGPPVGPSVVALLGDVTGLSNANTVGRIQGRPFSANAPSINDIPTWDGTQWIPRAGGGLFQEVAGAAVSLAVPTMTNASGRIVVAGTSLDDMFALRGISLTASAANGDPILVAGDGAKTGALFGGLTIREAQFAAGGAIVPMSGLAAYLAGATPGTYYRRVGHAISAQEILEDWGEPLEVPGP